MPSDIALNINSLLQISLVCGIINLLGRFEVNIDFQILCAKFALCKDFSRVEEDFQKLCELGNMDTLRFWYTLYSVGDNPFIDDKVMSFKKLTLQQRLELLRKMHSLEYGSEDWNKIDGLLARDRIKGLVNCADNEAKKDKSQVFLSILSSSLFFVGDDYAKIAFQTPEDYRKFDNAKFDLCMQNVLSSTPDQLYKEYVGWVASMPYSEDLANYQLKDKQPVKSPLAKYSNARDSVSLFGETLLYWDRFSIDEKVKRLQMYEHINANLHSREEREIYVPKKSTRLKDDSFVVGSYVRGIPQIINISPITLTQFDAIHAMDSTYHEGYHALFHDFMRDAVDLKTMDHYGSTEEFKKKYKDVLATIISIGSLFPDRDEQVLEFFDDFSYEEQVVYKESLIYATYNLLKIADTSNIKIVFDKYFLTLNHYLRHEKSLRKVPFTNEELLQANVLRREVMAELEKEVPKLTKIQKMPTIDDVDLKQCGKTGGFINLTNQQVETVVALVNRALRQLAEGNVYQVRKEFESTVELMR